MGYFQEFFFISQRSEACNPGQFQNEANLICKTIILKQTAEQRLGVKNRNELNWDLCHWNGFICSRSSVFISQSVKAVFYTTLLSIQNISPILIG